MSVSVILTHNSVEPLDWFAQMHTNNKKGGTGEFSLGALLFAGTSSQCPRAVTCLSEPKDTAVKGWRKEELQGERAGKDCSGIHLVHHVSAVSRDTRWVCHTATKDSHACWGSRDRSPHVWMMGGTIASMLTRRKIVHFYSWHECSKNGSWWQSQTDRLCLILQPYLYLIP